MTEGVKKVVNRPGRDISKVLELRGIWQAIGNKALQLCGAVEFLGSRVLN